MSTPTTPPAADALRPAKPPVGLGSAPLVAQLFALLLVVLGAIAVQDTVSRAGWISQASWIDTLTDSFGTVSSSDPLVLVVAVVAAVLGVLLLPVPFMRRPRTSVPLRSETGVHLRTRDLRKVVAHTLEGTDAVTDTSVRTNRRTVKVVVTTLAAKDRNAEIAQSVRDRLAPTLEALEKAPRLKVGVKNGDLS